MWIAMAMRDHALEVTIVFVNVSNRVMDTVWWNHTWTSRYSIASAVLDTFKGGTPPRALGKLLYSFPTSKIKRSCPLRTGKRADEFQERI